jgi:hypothetical protein
LGRAAVKIMGRAIQLLYSIEDLVRMNPERAYFATLHQSEKGFIEAAVRFLVSNLRGLVGANPGCLMLTA